MKRLMMTAAAVALMVTAATANPRCTAHERLVETLTGKYGEEFVGTGLGGGQKVELYVNPDKDTYTIVARSGFGRACIVTAGKNWRFIVPPVTLKGTKS